MLCNKKKTKMRMEMPEVGLVSEFCVERNIPQFVGERGYGGAGEIDRER